MELEGDDGDDDRRVLKGSTVSDLPNDKKSFQKGSKDEKRQLLNTTASGFLTDIIPD